MIVKCDVVMYYYNCELQSQLHLVKLYFFICPVAIENRCNTILAALKSEPLLGRDYSLAVQCSVEMD